MFLSGRLQLKAFSVGGKRGCIINGYCGSVSLPMANPHNGRSREHVAGPNVRTEGQLSWAKPHSTKEMCKTGSTDKNVSGKRRATSEDVLRTGRVLLLLSSIQLLTITLASFLGQSPGGRLMFDTFEQLLCARPFESDRIDARATLIRAKGDGR